MQTEDHQDTEALIMHTGDIVASFVANNAVATDDVPTLITNVYGALAKLGGPAEEPAPEPAVPVNKSVKREHIVCLECGGKFKMMKRHLRTDHDLTPEDYRERWGLNTTYPMVAPAYSETRSELAKEIGLGKVGNPRRRSKTRS